MRTARSRWLLLALLAAPPGVRAAVVDWAALDSAPEGGVEAASVHAFARAVREATGGALGMDVQPAGTGDDVAATVATGRVEVGTFPLALLEEAEPALAMDRVPFLVTDFVNARKLWDVLRPRVEQALSARGMLLLYAVPGPPPAPLGRRPLAGLADWSGARLVADAPSIGPLARLLGADATSGTPAARALSESRADLALVPAPAAVRDRAWEYASHYLHAPAWFPKRLVVVSRRALTALEPALRDLLLDEADAAGESAWSQAWRETERGVQALRDHGVKTLEPDVQHLIALEAIGRELLFLWSEAAGEAGAELVERYYAVR